MKTTITALFIIVTVHLCAQWNTNTTINTAIVIADKSQKNIVSVSDTKKGSMICWDDNRNLATTSTDVYAQRIKSNGFTKWSGDVAVCTANGIQKSTNIVSGGVDGSCIITWEDGRAGNYDIYAQKIDSSGNILWGVNGVVVCNKATNQKSPKMISDNTGGAIIVWEDSASYYFDIYAQRLNSSGVAQWTTNGVAICTAPNQQINARIDYDGLGGAIITWQDKRNNIDYDIYAQQINALGVTGWSSNGIVICNAVNTQNNPRIEPDGSNGAFIAWTDKRNAIDYNIYMQRINASGIVQWSLNGVVVCNATNNQSALDMKYIGANGIICSWKDDRTTANQIYAQLIDLSGISQLATNGIQLSTGLKSAATNVIKDEQGGVIIAWQDSTSTGWDIKSQKLNSSGTIQWLSGGVIVSNAIDDQTTVTQTIDGSGGAIYIWEDRRNGTDNEIYAHHLFYNGDEIVGLKEFTKQNNLDVVCFPNPINNNSVIEIKNNTINQFYEIIIYDAFGNEIKKQLFQGNKYQLYIPDFSLGMYFYTIQLTDKSASYKGKFVLDN